MASNHTQWLRPQKLFVLRYQLFWNDYHCHKHTKRNRFQLRFGSSWQIMMLIIYTNPWWRHQMETFSALLAICAGNSPLPGEFPVQRPVTRSFDVFFNLRLNKRLSKQSWVWWFEALSCSLWRHCNAINIRIPCVEILILTFHHFPLPTLWYGRGLERQCNHNVVLFASLFVNNTHVS